MTRLLAGFGILGTLLWVAACERKIPTELAVDSGACPQTREFSNYGCARLVVIVEGPPQPWPVERLWDVRAVPAREGAGGGLVLAPRPDTGAVPLELIRWYQPAPGTGDSASVWVSAAMFDDSHPPGPTLQVFAADSVLHVARFAPVGSRPPTDTVRLTLRRR
jgi:hypothetical protein